MGRKNSRGQGPNEFVGLKMKIKSSTWNNPPWMGGIKEYFLLLLLSCTADFSSQCHQHGNVVKKEGGIMTKYIIHWYSEFHINLLQFKFTREQHTLLWECAGGILLVHCSPSSPKRWVHTETFPYTMNTSFIPSGTIVMGGGLHHFLVK